jgi:hypothetical protein
MKQASRSWLRLIILVLSVTALSVGTTSAQDFGGKFTLPVETQWGSVVLQPGDYTMSLTRFQGGQRVVTIRPDASSGSAAMILVRSKNLSPSLTDTDLVCVQEGGALVVRSLEVGPLGETLYFPMPTGAPLYSENRPVGNHALLAETRGTIERLPVSFDSR